MVYSFVLPYAKEIRSDEKQITEVIPDIQVPLKCLSGKDISFRILPKSTTEIKKGDSLVEILFYRTRAPQNGHYYGDVVGKHIIKSDHSGYVFHDCNDHRYTIDSLARPILIYSSLEELIYENYPIAYELKEDDFSSTRYIKWKWFGDDEDSSLSNKYALNAGTYLSFMTDKDLPVLILEYTKDRFSIKKKDTISFKFEDGTIRHFPVLKPSVKCSGKMHFMTTIPLTSSDIELFSTVGWERMRIEYCDGASPEVINNQRYLFSDEFSEEFSRMLFRVYAQTYKRALADLGIVLKHDKPELLDISTPILDESEMCYVYLMKDTSNGYHKIGISNHPDYREKTLQSEKPSIIKICAKKYPSRIIAQSIESALHTAFASKRIRGEWFNLSDLDVAQLIAALT